MAKRPPSNGTSGTKLRRNNGNYVQDHPVGFITAAAECFDDFEALGVFQALLQRGFMLHLLAQFDGETFDVNTLEQFFDRFRTHHRLKAGGTELLIELAVLGFVLDYFVIFYRSFSRLDYDIGFEVQARLRGRAKRCRASARCGSAIP